jgi:hypothetical protein
MTSVVAAFVAVAVTALAHAPDPIAPVPIAVAPLAMVEVTPPFALKAFPSAVKTLLPAPLKELTPTAA